MREIKEFMTVVLLSVLSALAVSGVFFVGAATRVIDELPALLDPLEACAVEWLVTPELPPAPRVPPFSVVPPV